MNKVPTCEKNREHIKRLYERIEDMIEDKIGIMARLTDLEKQVEEHRKRWLE